MESAEKQFEDSIIKELKNILVQDHNYSFLIKLC